MVSLEMLVGQSQHLGGLRAWMVGNSSKTQSHKMMAYTMGLMQPNLEGLTLVIGQPF